MNDPIMQLLLDVGVADPEAVVKALCVTLLAGILIVVARKRRDGDR